MFTAPELNRRRWMSTGSGSTVNSRLRTTQTSMFEPRTSATSCSLVHLTKPSSTESTGHANRHQLANSYMPKNCLISHSPSSTKNYYLSSINATNHSKYNVPISDRRNSVSFERAASISGEKLSSSLPSYLSYNHHQSQLPRYHTMMTTAVTPSSSYNVRSLREYSTPTNRPRVDRPWRQRLADTSRLRNIHGNEIGGAISSTLAAVRAHRNSITSQQQHGDDRAQNMAISEAMLMFLENHHRLQDIHVIDHCTTLHRRHFSDLHAIPTISLTSKFRSYSPVQPKTPTNTTSTSHSSPFRSVRSANDKFSNTINNNNNNNNNDNDNNDDESGRKATSIDSSTSNRQIFNEKVVNESSHLPVVGSNNNNNTANMNQELNMNRRLSSRDRTLRHRSRQHENLTDSSGSEQRAESREKRLRKKLLKKMLTDDHKQCSNSSKESSMTEIRKCATKMEEIFLECNITPKDIAMKLLESSLVLLNDRNEVHCFEEITLKCAASNNKSSNASNNDSTSGTAVKANKEILMGNTKSTAKKGSGSAANGGIKKSAALFALGKKKKGFKNQTVNAKSKLDDVANTLILEEQKTSEFLTLLTVNVDDTTDVNICNKHLCENNVNERQKSFHSPISKEYSPNDQLNCSQHQSASTFEFSATVFSDDINSYLQQKPEEIEQKSVIDESQNVSKFLAPVPGIWNGPEQDEMNISQIRHLKSNNSSGTAKIAAVIAKKCTNCSIPPLKIISPKQLNTTKIGADFDLKSDRTNENLIFKMRCPRTINMEWKIHAPTMAYAYLNCSFSSRKRSIEQVSRKIIIKLRANERCLLGVIEPKLAVIAIVKRLKNNRSICASGAQVVVLAANVPTANFKNFDQFLQIKSSEHRDAFSNSLPLSSLNAGMKQQQTNFERCNDNCTFESTEDHQQLRPLPLEQNLLQMFDESTLRKCVEEKRKKMKYLSGEITASELSKINEESPTTAAFQLINACSVQIVDPTRNFPYFTMPSRSRLGSVDVDTEMTQSQVSTFTTMTTMTTNYTSDELPSDERLLSASFHGLKASPFGASRGQRSASLTKTSFNFNPPLSPFEKNLQNQAYRLRQTSIVSPLATNYDSNSCSLTNLSTQETPTSELSMRRLSKRDASIDNSEALIATTFTAAATASSNNRRSERYAAHIPLSNGGSSRQSTASVESPKSGALETATRQLDQMIDQARFRHHRHRSKFKEAIDYLDQIFEDLKKEGDSSSPVNELPIPSHEPISGRELVATRKKLSKDADNESTTKRVVPQVKMRSLAHTSDEVLRKKKESDKRYGELSTITSYQKNSSPLQVFRPLEKQKLNGKCDSEEEFFATGDVSVSKTLVLSCSNKKLKGDKMDYTRKWIAGDIKSWTSAQPKPDLLIDGTDDDFDTDEHSLGSCSAEVAAINLKDRKIRRASDVPDLIQNIAPIGKFVRGMSNQHLKKSSGSQKINDSPKQQYLVPKPVKPQPVYAVPTSSKVDDFDTNFAYQSITRNDDDFYRSYSSHQRAHSGGGESILWRPSSQDPYGTLSSVKSMDVDLPGYKTGAFTPLHLQPPNIVSMRGSVMSLPEPQTMRNPDPTLAIDALVAELELNTDQTGVVDKRRSFPTGIELAVQTSVKRTNSINVNATQKGHSTTPTRCKPTARRQQQNHTFSSRSKATFDEMTTMLESVTDGIETNNNLSSQQKRKRLPLKGGVKLSPFETINHEKFNPSKVVALQSMFESKGAAPNWHRNSRNNSRALSVHEDYYEIGDTTHTKKKNSQKCNEQSAPPIPATQPPSHPPGSANSSQAGGYYSSGSSLGIPTSHNQSTIPCTGTRSSFTGKQSTSSGIASLDDEDGGFYDNIDSMQSSNFAESDNNNNNNNDDSVTSNFPPTRTTKGNNRLGQFLRRISSSKPPANAISVISLNKISNDATSNSFLSRPLMKSNSLSGEPWKKVIIESNGEASSPSRPADKRTGIGQRLKNSIFGSKKRL